MLIKTTITETKQVEKEIELPYYFEEKLSGAVYMVTDEGKYIRVYHNYTDYASISVDNDCQKELSAGIEIEAEFFYKKYTKALSILGLYTANIPEPQTNY